MNWVGSGFIPIIIYAALADIVTPTPGSEFRITDNSDRRITDNNDNRITD